MRAGSLSLTPTLYIRQVLSLQPDLSLFLPQNLQAPIVVGKVIVFFSLFKKELVALKQIYKFSNAYTCE